MEQARSIWSNISGLLRVAVRAFFTTIAIALALGVVLAIAGYVFLSDHPGYAILLAALILVEAAVFGVFGGFQRALASALVHGVETMQLGRRLVGAIFNYELGMAADQQGGGRGNQVARSIERIPLAQAENALAQAVSNLLRGDEAASGLTGRLRRGIQTRLLEAIQRITLARFREEGAREGGVDLRKIQGELEGRMDEYLIDRFGGGANFATGLLLGGLTLAAIAQGALLNMLAE